jgi:chromosome segregation ATPase
MARVSSPGSPPTASQATAPPKDSPDCASSAAETVALKRRVQCLEQDKATLAARVADVETRTAAAEVEAKKSDVRAQERYTEKLHANNESRHLKLAVEKHEFERRDYMIKVKRVCDDLSSRIQKLEAEKASAVFQLQACEERAAKLQHDLQACQAENGELKESQKTASNTITALEGNVSKLQSDLTAEQAKTRAATAAASTPEELEASVNAIRADAANTARAEMARLRAKLQVDAKAWREKTILETRIQVQAQMQPRFDQTLQKELQQARKPLADEKEKSASLEQQLNDAKKEIESINEKLNIATRAMTSLQKQSQQNVDFVSNKRRRLNSIG